MAQIKTGTVSVENGSNVVTGTGTTWLTDGVQAGDGFVIATASGIDGAGVYYTVGGSVTETGLQLSSNWAGATDGGLAYVIVPDFIAPGYPQLLPGDLEAKPLINQNFQKLINDKASALVSTASGASQTVAGALDDRVVRVGSVAGLADVTPADDLQFSVGEFWPDTGVGGGLFEWDATRSKTEHNGVTVIDPDKLSQLGAIGVFGTYFTAAGSGAGVFERSGEITLFSAGVIGNGTDESIPMQAAASIPDPIYIKLPPVYYKFGDVKVPWHKSWLGVSPPLYNPLSVSEMEGKCAFVIADGATNMFLKEDGDDQIRHQFFCGVLFYGDQAKDFWPQSQRTKFLLCGGYNWRYSPFGSVGYCKELEAVTCHSAQNVYGIRDIIDSKIIGGYVNANTRGSYCGTGSNDNTFTDVKNEFNGINYLFTGGAKANVINGGIVDRSQDGPGIRHTGGGQLTVNGTTFRRNGANILGDNECAHIYTETIDKLSLGGIITEIGQDDGGGGDVTPNYVLTFGGASNGEVTAVGNDFTGFVTAPIRTIAKPDSLILTNNQGADDERNVGSVRVESGKTAAYIYSTPEIVAAGSDTESVESVPLGTFSRRTLNIDISVRNASSGATLSGILLFTMSREGGSASVVFQGVVFSSSATAVGNTASESFQVEINNVATDGSSYDVVVTNNSGSTLRGYLDIY